MTTRRGRALAGLLASLAALLAVPAAWSASAPAEVAGSRAAIAQSAPPPAPPPAPSPAPPPAPPSSRVLWQPAPVPTPAPAAAAPVEVDIAGVGVVAAIDPVGVDRDGSMVIPEDAHRVGWYEHGAAPGSDKGSAVLAGHVDSRRQGRGAMFALRNVEVGEPIRVRLADGTIVGYRVVAHELVAKAALPVTELFSRAGPPRLTLITCGGDYDRGSGGYQDNVVVTAVPEGPTGSALGADVESHSTIAGRTGIA
jgi:hypothetical protein